MRIFLAANLGLVSLVLLTGCNTSKPPAPPLVELTEDEPQQSEESSSAGSGVVPIDPELPKYVPVSGVSGSIKSAGSDTMSNLMALWTGGFRKFYPSVKVEMESKGTASAPPALIEATADFGAMSRRMKPSEIDDFQERFRYRPTELEAAIDMLAIYVNKDNPLAGLTFPQADAIFSNTRKLGLADEIRTWDQVGLSREFAKKPISLYGRNSASGTYGFFRERVLGGGDYKDTVKEQPGSSSVVQGITADKFGMGYSGIGYMTPGVRAVPLAVAEGDEFIPADPSHAYSGDYPLSRTLNVAVNHKPDSELDPLRREFIKYLFSQEGQQEVIKDGYFPVTAEMARKQLQSVGIAVEF